MKTSLHSFSALALVVSGCGMFSEPDSVLPVDDGVPTAPTRSPEATPLGEKLVDSELDESFGVFVRADAAPGGDGTRARPFATLAEGITAANERGKRVYACDGTYRETVAIADGVSMAGGLDCTTEGWAIGSGRSWIESPISPALTAVSIAKPTRFSRFDVVAPDGTPAARSSIAFFATNAGALTIAKSRITAGNGADGADGVEPAPTAVTGDPNGKAGMTAREYCWWTSDKACWNTYGFQAEPGGAGGSITCNGAPSNAGGAGGSGGVWESVFAGEGRIWVPKNGLANGAGGSPQGAPSATAGGASAALPGTWSRDGFASADGTRGANGASGRSGAGGSGFTPTTDPNNKFYWYASHGSGGGAGGCGGVAGTPGEGGGASVAAFVVDGAVAFVETELVAKSGGRGGRGTFGSAATAGGFGGPVTDGHATTKGQDGEAGMRAGTSGSGAGGSSVAVVHFGAAPKLEKTTLTVGTAGSGAPPLEQGRSRIAPSSAGEAREILGF